MVLTRSTVDPRLDMTEAEISAAAISVVPEVARRNSSGADKGMLAGVAGVLMLGGITFYMLSSGREAPQPAPARQPVQAPAPAVAPPAPAPVPAPAPQPVVIQAPAPAPVAAADPQAANRLRAPALVVDASAAPTDAEAAAKPGAPTRGLSRDEQFADRIAAANVETARATRMANPQTTVPQGTLIPAVLETALNSDLPGFARAVVTEDVRSFDGSAVLVPRGSRVIGQYRGGLQVGQTRAFVMWTRLLRPDGVSVQLGSPGTDDLGRAGLTGDVDTHFFKRFGSAVLMSVVGAAGAIGGGSTAVIIGSGAQDAASVALQRDVNISPTVKVAQGEPIRIFTARDLDFSGVQQGIVQ